MKVFSNTTPFIALASIQRLDLLSQLFGQILVTEEVIGECAVDGPIGGRRCGNSLGSFGANADAAALPE